MKWGLWDPVVVRVPVRVRRGRRVRRDSGVETRRTECGVGGRGGEGPRGHRTGRGGGGEEEEGGGEGTEGREGRNEGRERRGCERISPASRPRPSSLHASELRLARFVARPLISLLADGICTNPAYKSDLILPITPFTKFVRIVLPHLIRSTNGLLLIARLQTVLRLLLLVLPPVLTSTPRLRSTNTRLLVPLISSAAYPPPPALTPSIKTTCCSPSSGVLRPPERRTQSISAPASLRLLADFPCGHSVHVLRQVFRSKRHALLFCRTRSSSSAMSSETKADAILPLPVVLASSCCSAAGTAVIPREIDIPLPDTIG